jgi:hypothetical protein
VSWRAIFFINLPLGAFVIYQTRRHIPETRDPTATGRVDLPGAVLATLALGGLSMALIRVSDQGIGSVSVLASLVLGVVSTFLFIAVERTSRNPMLPLEIFRSRQFTSANLVTFVVYAALGGVFFLLVVFLQVSLGYSPIAAGAATLPLTAVMLVGSPRGGELAQRIGPRLPLTVGPLIIAAALFWMRGIDIGDGYVEAVLPPVVLFGVGLSLVVAPITATVLSAADPNHVGVASGVNNAVARTAGLAAVAVFPLIAGLSGNDYENPVALAAGFKDAMLAAAVLSAAGGLLAWATISDDVLELAEKPGREPCREALEAAPEYHSALAGAPVHSATRGESGALAPR